jgi:hypothetical protein
MGSSTATTMISSALLNPMMDITITEKLGKANHAMWKAQILTTMHGSCMEGHLNGATLAPDEEIPNKDSADKKIMVPNPTFEEWYFKDQQVLAQVVAKDTTTKLWTAIEGMYASQNRARVVNTQLALATTQKGYAIYHQLCWQDANAR